MTDCPNAEVRDLLPDLVHGQLDARARALVEAHVSSCADCLAEVALLRELRTVLGAAPRLDLPAIAAVVAPYRAPSRRSWMGWRAAAAITVLVAGGSSVALIQRNVAPRGDALVVATRPAPVAPDAVPGGGPSPAASVREPAPAALRVPAASAPVARGPVPAEAGGELAVGAGSLNELSDRELASLLRDIESLDGVPVVEVDNAPLAPVAPPPSRRGAP